ncbi:Stearoyl-CoA desaturase 5-like protein [Leptotrombidium deliense]|uniref:Stearoyl-CoA desaturase 5-like protein n=1 Tax=Leptotrombidium deliense TaxID=299467 RepID=A0A443SFG7_9ACAR|nr:Stearoyl-CoA desaturase 5-like protein [Leptotrombidium deliense]
MEEKQELIKSKPYKNIIVWKKVFFMVYLHLGAFYGIYLCFVAAKWKTIFFAYFLYIFSGLGVGSGAHRLWSHRSYKATTFFRCLLCFMDSIAFQVTKYAASIFEWSRDHRVHHKCSETDGDPYNSSRGFFFSHMGWLMVKKHPKVIEMGRKVDIQDLLDDKIVQFQHK